MTKPTWLVKSCNWLSDKIGNWALAIPGTALTTTLPLWLVATVSEQTSVPTNIIEKWWPLSLIVGALAFGFVLERLRGHKRVRWEWWPTTRWTLVILAGLIVVSNTLPSKQDYIFGENADHVLMLALLEMYVGCVAALLAIVASLLLTTCAGESRELP